MSLPSVAFFCVIQHPIFELHFAAFIWSWHQTSFHLTLVFLTDLRENRFVFEGANFPSFAIYFATERLFIQFVAPVAIRRHNIRSAIVCCSWQQTLIANGFSFSPSSPLWCRHWSSMSSMTHASFPFFFLSVPESLLIVGMKYWDEVLFRSDNFLC